MDGSGFDALTRALSGLRSRRGLGRLLLGAALGGAPALRELDDAQAKRGAARKKRKRREQHRERDQRDRDGAQADKKRKKKPCPPCKKRKQGKCKGTLPDGAACPGGTCQAGSCRAGQSCTCQGKTCGDDGCGGSCGTCNGWQRCAGSACICDAAACQNAFSGCCVENTCVPTDILTDGQNCGSCGTICSFAHAEARCEDGICTFGDCDAGWTNCDGLSDTGCEIHPGDDLANCGECGRACASGQGCADGNCVCDAIACFNAGGCCVLTTCQPRDFQTDPSNCGTCRMVCDFAHAGATCANGVCEMGACNEGYANCDGLTGTGCETNIYEDHTNCGLCGHACSGDTPVCNGSGVCACGDVCANGCRFTRIQDAIDAAQSGDQCQS